MSTHSLRRSVIARSSVATTTFGLWKIPPKTDLRPNSARRNGAFRYVRRVLSLIALSCLALFVGLFVRSNHAYITTPSMYPTIPPGSMTFINAEPNYRVGDIIEFKANGLLWIHRLTGIRPNGSYITKGDNPLSKPDLFIPEVRQQDVVGKVTFSIPYVGFPELILHQPGYGLTWLRAELGFAGKFVVFGVVSLASLLLLWSNEAAVPAKIISLPREELEGKMETPDQIVRIGEPNTNV